MDAISLFEWRATNALTHPTKDYQMRMAQSALICVPPPGTTVVVFRTDYRGKQCQVRKLTEVVERLQVIAKKADSELRKTWGFRGCFKNFKDSLNKGETTYDG